MALDVTGDSSSNGANMQIWTPYNPTNQQYTFPATDSGYSQVVAQNSGKSVEVTGNSTASGANVDQSTYTGATGQQWLLQPSTATQP
jgi:hypothetical protein